MWTEQFLRRSNFCSTGKEQFLLYSDVALTDPNVIKLGVEDLRSKLFLVMK